MNMNMYQTPGYGYPNNNFMGQGMVPNQQAAVPKTGNWLSADKYAMLQKGLSQFKLSVTEEELAKGQCNHYNLNGTTALVPDQDGSGGYTCTVCGTHFTSKDFAKEEVEVATQNVLDILNTIKIMYLSLDPTAACEYFQIIPFIEKIPQLYNIAVADFKKYEGTDTFINPQQQNPFNMFAAMTSPNFLGGGYGMPQQPAMQPNAAYAQMNPGFNPMYGAPVGYQPQMQGYAMNPMGAAAPMGYPQPGFVNNNMPMGNAAPQAAPAAPTAAAPAEEPKVEVNTQFKK